MILASPTLTQLAPEATDFGEIEAITLFTVIQGYRFWYHCKARMQLMNIISYILSPIVSEILSIIGPISDVETAGSRHSLRMKKTLNSGLRNLASTD